PNRESINVRSMFPMGMTPLLTAIGGLTPESEGVVTDLVRVLLNGGANPHMKSLEPFIEDGERQTARELVETLGTYPNLSALLEEAEEAHLRASHPPSYE